jgi:hypothetical protein
MTAPVLLTLRDRLGAIVAALLSLAAWIAFNLLSALGVLALAAFAIGNFTLAGTMLQLGNLTARFIAADASRQSQFGHLAAWAMLGAFSVIGLLRSDGAIKALLPRKGH